MAVVEVKMVKKEISEKMKKLNKEAKEGKTVIKGLGFCANATGGNASVVDVNNGKIIRIRPLHYDWKYKPEEFRPWKIEARGKVFQPTMKSLIPPLSLAYKKRVYSPNRILYPLKRVDFDPDGDRNVENRGKSGYVRISWDEALEIVASEIKRIQGKYEPVWIHPADAAERGMENGDVVKVYNDRGVVLGGAYVTEGMIPDVVYQDHGVRYDPIVPGELDKAGANSTIAPRKTTSKNATGMATSGFLVEVERVDLGELMKKYPEAFRRPYHPAAGLLMERVLVGRELK